MIPSPLLLHVLLFVVVVVVVVVVVSLFIASFSCCSCSAETDIRVGRIAILIRVLFCAPPALREADIVLVGSCVCVCVCVFAQKLRNYSDEKLIYLVCVCVTVNPRSG